ncbi:hypothetical protein D3C77_503670 [compost metagenome]
MLKGLPPWRYSATTGLRAAALTGGGTSPATGLGSWVAMAAQTLLATVMALPLRSMANAVTSSAWVPMPMWAARGWPASIWAPSSSPSITRSSRIFQFAWASRVT